MKPFKKIGLPAAVLVLVGLAVLFDRSGLLSEAPTSPAPAAESSSTSDTPAATPSAGVSTLGALEPGGSAKTVEVIDGDTLILSNGLEVRLVGTQAPKLPLGRKGFAAWPLAPEAKDALEAIAFGRTLSLGYGGQRRDRHGRTLAHLYDAEGNWIQGQMLAAGLARVYSFPDNRALVPEMLALERQARDAGRGIWADPYYAVRSPEGAAARVDSYELVEGRVLSAAVVRGRAYLNFGRDWDSDFTVTIDSEARRAFDRAGIDPEVYEGRRIRVRGWLRSYKGPMIEVTHPEQIEVLD